MCFSAEASFGASATLLTIGIVSARKSRNTPQYMLASIPIIFGVQQFVEGILWLSLSHQVFSLWHNMATYAFLIFAQVVWPVLLPLAVTLLEKDTRKRNAMSVFLAMGVFISSYLAYCLLFYDVGSSISCSHIRYDVHYPIRIKHLGILYFAVTVIPPVISSIKRLRLLGVVIFVSYVVTKIFYEDYLISVWCFFATIISIIALSVIIQLNKPPKLTDVNLPA